ncbi:hypothetical protein FGO68_gene5878 [Halteria grandinella]|uniref:Uncharacterized protein n=1 Tax=Halteria grandinella TaxID=5974 RepID=A0A8J8N9I4_HALGN|nr:hypothetical protein FGO68_gene5878 [Halteria grandinella]
MNSCDTALPVFFQPFMTHPWPEFISGTTGSGMWDLFQILTYRTYMLFQTSPAQWKLHQMHILPMVELVLFSTQLHNSYEVLFINLVDPRATINGTGDIIEVINEGINVKCFSLV